MTCLTKRDFFEPMTSFFDGFGWMQKVGDEFDKILNGKCDFEEEENKYLINLEVPGVKKEEINIGLKDETLTISWSRKVEKNQESKNSRYERRDGSFTRSFSVKGADFEKIDAQLKNGVLTIEIPKLETIKAKKIEIK
ncbi:MAG: hypothetical protein A2086_02540 [Spirochaetes bacterium GWD1_27_9]|nr:MAG: hypothetical protein A2Z98_01145 [Spirochaetes bacterium GWB1_27_13]OHD20106.1 MAG: hypothetical protein A2Y34_03250 [Spirochaetes bacterium GWC1_27_15]OHD35896.1 MAG: hypothetical protein A2086_02540 [Spirochaetes bacterium GWD1_27_9]